MQAEAEECNCITNTKQVHQRGKGKRLTLRTPKMSKVYED